MTTTTQVLDQMIADPTINGQHVDVDHLFGGQCWDLVELYAEKIGVPKEPWAIPLGPNGWASEAWTYYDKSPHMQKYFDKVPAGQQQKGDITVYNGHPGFEEGHIAISLGGNAVFEENADPDGAPAHVYNNRSNTYLLGALRLKGSDMPANLTENSFYECFRGMMHREPTPQEAKTMTRDPELLIQTLWNNGAADLYYHPPKPDSPNYKPYDGPQLYEKTN